MSPRVLCYIFLDFPILFLIFINDLLDNIHSIARLFTDDCVLYRNIRRSEDQQILQDDLDRLAHWEEAWVMKFNVAKRHSMRVNSLWLYIA